MPRLAAALILVLVCPGVCLAQTRAEDANLSANPTGSPGTASRLVIAQRAYLHALKTGEVLPLIAAIRLARSITLRPATSWELTPGPTDKPTDAPADAAEGPPQALPDPASAAALAIAQNLAGEDPDLQDLVYDLDAQLPRGRPETAVTATGRLAPGQTDSWRIALFGEVSAELALIGDGRAALGLTLSDEGGTTLCAVPASPDPALCRLTPARNGFFTLAIRNAGPGPADYRLFGN